MLNPLLAKINSLTTLSPDDETHVRSLRVEERQVKAGEELIFIGDKPSRSFLLTEGYTCMYKITGKGDRQIVNLHVVGDMPDLQSLYAKQMDVSILALTNTRISYISHDDIRTMCVTRPDLNKVFWRMSLIEAGTAREWIVNVGQRDAKARLAHVLCEIYTRLEAVGLARNGVCPMPITQIDLADATGQTPVHVNRSLQDLRRDGLLKLTRKTLTIPDWGRLARMADFDPMYLQLADPPPTH